MNDSKQLVYPRSPAGRDEWVIRQRPARELHDAYLPYSYFIEEERSKDGTIEPIATVFLTNRECRFHCVMCDLWRNTLEETVPIGAIPAQIDHALSELSAAPQIKLYNSSSFFDKIAIPYEDYPAIATRVSSFRRVIVESHPSLIADSALHFRNLLDGQLEIAMGLETAHPEILALLNKRLSVEQFRTAASLLNRNQIDLRVFILVKPPFMATTDALFWAKRSLDVAFECGATAATLIPTRGGNGAMETLADAGRFSPPSLKLVEDAMEYGLNLKAGRVFVDLWNLSKSCLDCHDERKARLALINLRQAFVYRTPCPTCGDKS